MRAPEGSALRRVPNIKKIKKLTGWYPKLIFMKELNFYAKNLNTNKKHIVVVGMGFVGLTLGLTLAESGHNVIGLEQNEISLKNYKMEILTL